MITRVTADQIMDMDSMELKNFRASFFLDRRDRYKTMDQRMALLDFMVLLSLVQDMRDWSILSEPGLAGKMLDAGEEWEGEIEDAREIDRRSLEMHEEIAREFESKGGRPALAAALARLNELCE